MAGQPEVHGGFVLGPDGIPHNVLAAFNGNNTYLADNNGQQVDQFWQQHNHYRTGPGSYDGGGVNRPYYTGPGH